MSVKINLIVLKKKDDSYSLKRIRIRLIKSETDPNVSGSSEFCHLIHLHFFNQILTGFERI